MIVALLVNVDGLLSSMRVLSISLTKKVVIVQQVKNIQKLAAETKGGWFVANMCITYCLHSDDVFKSYVD